ncbi:MAG: T9SS type A sorting domain-containing protein, partial [Candidatus Marinimicrobia bacterium]|nr:T9SS type A sorting domain-containing protein [Candidatus Neomarinimicrobiota bacterium]
GEYIHIHDSDNNANFDETTIECGNSEDCITYMGNLFYIHGNSSVDSVFIYNKNENAVEVNIAAFSTIGSLFNPEPSFVQNVTLSESNAWNAFSVEDWNFENPYIIAHTITDEISISLDTEASPLGGFFNGSSWESIETGYSYYTTGIRAKIAKENSNVEYNVYRIDETNSEFLQIAYLLPDSTFIDRDVIELQEYIYGVSATYPENNQESPILIQTGSISILPESYQELSWDDGIFESSIEVEANDSLAVKFRASNMGQKIVRFKWHQLYDGGIIKIIIWDNSQEGLPGNIINSKLATGYNAISGWNEYDLSAEDWSVSGDFWIGIKGFSTTQPIAIDYDVGTNASTFRNPTSEWMILDDWNMGFRVYLDCVGSNVDECGVCDGDNSTCLDCAGVPNGNSIEDCSGVCNGDAKEDCAGVCNGDAVVGCDNACCDLTITDPAEDGFCLVNDECGVCGGSGPIGECGCDNIPIGFCDCSANLFDECNICDGDNSSCADCLDVPNGDAVIDECYVCSNPETYNSTCTGCMDSSANNIGETETPDVWCPNNECEYHCDDCCSYTLTNDANIIPSKFEIINLYPNPFNPQINIEYNLPTTSNVRVSIYNVKGQEVDRLVDSIQYTGFHSLTWVATEQNSGIYFVQITADTNIINQKVMYLK